MKKLVMVWFLVMLSWAYFAPASEGRGNRINWLQNYDEAIRTARASSKPIVILFTGSDWCTWCIKLEDEALNTQEFADAAGDKFVFVKLDFPLNRTQPADIAAQNKRLQKQFAVQGYPTVVILDSEQRSIGTTGYRPGGGKQYATYLLQLIDGHTAYQQKVQNLENHSLSGIELKILYEQAAELNREQDAERLLVAGVASDQKNFFLLEQYRHLAEQDLSESQEAKAIRKQLLESDPNNMKLTYYQVAIIDFEAACRSADRNCPPEIIVAPLTAYIEKFGKQDKDSLWRLQMIISQVYLEKNKLPEALQFAQSSYHVAPATAQPDISFTIRNLQAQLSDW